MTVFETPRLTAAEVTEDDIAELLEVHLSNQAYLDLTEGSGGIAGAYDRGMLERDLMMSAWGGTRACCAAAPAERVSACWTGWTRTRTTAPRGSAS